MMTSDVKVGGWVKKGQNHDDVILECLPIEPAYYIANCRIFESKQRIRLLLSFRLNL